MQKALLLGLAVVFGSNLCSFDNTTDAQLEIGIEQIETILKKRNLEAAASYLERLLLKVKKNIAPVLFHYIALNLYQTFRQSALDAGCPKTEVDALLETTPAEKSTISDDASSITSKKSRSPDDFESDTFTTNAAGELSHKTYFTPHFFLLVPPAKPAA